MDMERETAFGLIGGWLDRLRPIHVPGEIGRQADPMDWVELAVDVDREAVEATSELFAQYGYNQGVVVEETIIPQPDEDYVVDLTAPVQVRTYIVADEQAEDIAQRLAEALWHLGRCARWASCAPRA